MFEFACACTCACAGVTPGQLMDNNLVLSPKGAEPGQMGEGGDGEVVQAGAALGAEAEVKAEGSVGPIRDMTDFTFILESRMGPVKAIIPNV